MQNHILVPVDLADLKISEKAVKTARHIAKRDGAKLSVITVIPAWPEDLRRTPKDFRPDFDAFLDKIRDGIEVNGIFHVGGSISKHILEAVKEHKIDLVVMASHNPRITDYLIGSNAAHVALHAPCSVLVVR